MLLKMGVIALVTFVEHPAFRIYFLMWLLAAFMALVQVWGRAGRDGPRGLCRRLALCPRAHACQAMAVACGVFALAYIVC